MSLPIPELDEGGEAAPELFTTPLNTAHAAPLHFKGALNQKFRRGERRGRTAAALMMEISPSKRGGGKNRTSRHSRKYLAGGRANFETSSTSGPTSSDELCYEVLRRPFRS